MTTKVTVEVPQAANYAVEISTKTDTATAKVCLKPGGRQEIYIHDFLEVTGIKEVPLSEAD